MRKLTLAICILFCSIISNAQPSNFYNGYIPNPNITSFMKDVEIPMEISRGIPVISVPIHTISYGDISLPISISYNASGIKINEPASQVGMNWSLKAGGAIFRSIKGVPDEFNGGYFTTYKNLTFVFGEPNDYSVREVANGNWDAEPDLFSFSFPGYSGKFYIDSSMQIQLIPRQDLKIEYSFDGTLSEGERLYRFTIITPEGLKYTFGKDAMTGELIHDKQDVEFATSGYNQYWKAPTAWHMTKIESRTNTNAFYLEYEKFKYQYKTPYSSFEAKYFSPSTQILFEPIQIDENINHETTSFVLKKIYGNHTKEEVLFNRSTIREDLGIINSSDSIFKAMCLDTISITYNNSSICKQFVFSYDHFETPDYDSVTSDYSELRLRLLELKEEACDGSVTVNPYKFTYLHDTLPATTSRAIDHWGFYNGKSQNDYSNGVLNIPPTTLTYYGGSITKGSSDRNVDTAFSKQGMLSNIELPTGGTKSYFFESNDYYDGSNGNVFCGGLRINNTKLDPNDGSSLPIIKNYIYKSYNTNNSSGELANEPSYGNTQVATVGWPCIFPPYVSCVNKKISVLTWHDGSIYPLYSFEGYHIYYKNVTESLSNNSETRYTYSPYSNAQPNGGRYPVIPLTFDNNTAKILNLTKRNETGNEVQSQSIDYSNSLSISPDLCIRAIGLPISMNDLGSPCCNNVTGLFFHSTYNIHTGFSLQEKITTVIDGVTSVKEYEFDPGLRFLFPIKEKTWNQGTLHETAYTYVHDYTAGDIKDSLLFQNRIRNPWKTEYRVDGNLFEGNESLFSFYLNNGYSTNTPTNYLYHKTFNKYERTWDENDVLQPGQWTLDNNIIKYHHISGNPMMFQPFGWGTFTSSFNNEGQITAHDYGTHSTTIGYYLNTELVEKITAIDGTSTSYIYDGLFRLKTKKDDIRNVITDFDYHYKDQSISGIGGSFNRNFIKTSISLPLIPGSDVSSLTEYNYLDGLGRELALVQLNSSLSGTHDVIYHQLYDSLGRNWKIFEAFQIPIGGSNNGKYYDNTSISEYEETNYYADPLNRIYQTTPPAWYPTTFEYASNSTTITDPLGKIYGIDSLIKSVATDPNGNKVITYIDKIGRSILEERQDSTGSNSITTYSVFDDKSRLSKVFPSGSSLSTPDLLFTNVYDGEDNLIKKKMPDSAPILYIYNDKDLISGMQNGNLLSQGKFAVSKNDSYGRVTQSGLFAGSSISNPNNPVITNILEEYFYDGFDGNTTQSGLEYIGKLRKSRIKLLDDLTVNSDFIETLHDFDLAGRVVLESNNHHLDLNQGTDFTAFSYDGLDNIMVADRTHLKGAASSRFNSVNSIDYRGRLNESSISINQDDFIRKARYQYTIKDQIDSMSIGGMYSNEPLYHMNYEYNPQGWLTQINDPISGDADDSPCDNGSSSFYNSSELFYLKLDYDQKESTMPHAVQKNGNVSSMLYQTNGKQLKGYSYDYDYLNRLTDASYGQFDVLTWSNTDFYSSNYTYDNRGNIMSLMRKQQSLDQYGSSNCYIAETIDSLTYLYQTNSNQIKQIMESAPCPKKIILPDTISRDITYAAELLIADKTYIDGRANVNLYADDELRILDTLHIGDGPGITKSYDNCPDNMGHVDGFMQTSMNGEYTFDNAGNMDADPNKSLTIFYNHLNLPYKYLTTSGEPQELRIQYDAHGIKLFQEHYRDGVKVSRRDYINGIEYEDDQLESFYYESGRAKFDDVGNYLMEYDIKDHLGNVRLRFADKNSNDEIDLNLSGIDDEILSVNHYYSFGLIQQGQWQKTETGDDNRYSYNGKELQDELDINLYHYGARLMDPAIGIFTGVDPLADIPLNIGTSTYAYVWNNPLINVDPDGRAARGVSDEFNRVWNSEFKRFDYNWVSNLGGNEFDLIHNVSYSNDGSIVSEGDSYVDGLVGFDDPQRGNYSFAASGAISSSFNPLEIPLEFGKGGLKLGLGLMALIRNGSDDAAIKFTVGRHKEIKKLTSGTSLSSHHVGQGAGMRKFVNGYDYKIGPAIAVPKIGHLSRGLTGRLSTNLNGITSARQLLARDIMQLRNVFPNIPNGALQDIIKMNKSMYPSAFKK